MSWMLPSAFGIAAAAAIAAIALHFISRRRPIAEPFPTARFIPEREVQARVPARAFGDPWLLLLRLAAIVLLGAGVAGPVLARRGKRLERIVVLDDSRNVASAQELRDSARAVLGNGDHIILMGNFARPVVAQLGPRQLTTTRYAGSLSAGLAAAFGMAGTLASRADSIAITLVSPVAPAEIDAATWAIRRTWPGSIRVVQLRAAAEDTAPLPMDVRADSNDALRAAAALDGLLAPPRTVSGAAAVRVIRAPAVAADSAWARGAQHVLVEWPASSDAARSAMDTVTAVGDDGAVLVGIFQRRRETMTGSVIARWIDGRPAVVERPLGAGCIREVGIAFDEHSDVAVRAPFLAFMRRLDAPCGASRAAGGVSLAAALDSLRGRGPAVVRAAALSAVESGTSVLSPWLLAAGALLLIAEMALRRSARRSIA